MGDRDSGCGGAVSIATLTRRFGGNVSGLTLASFFLMVGSSVIAAWADISSTLARLSIGVAVVDPTSGAEVPIPAPTHMLGWLNIGYAWMFLNCIASAAYVRPLRRLALRDRSFLCGSGSRRLVSKIGIRCFTTTCSRYRCCLGSHSLSRVGAWRVSSGTCELQGHRASSTTQPRVWSDIPSPCDLVLRCRCSVHLIFDRLVREDVRLYYVFHGWRVEQVSREYVLTLPPTISTPNSTL